MSAREYYDQLTKFTEKEIAVFELLTGYFDKQEMMDLLSELISQKILEAEEEHGPLEEVEEPVG